MASTIISWALTVSLIGVGLFYYRPDLFKSLTQQASQAAAPQIESLSSSKTANKRSKSKKSVLAKVSDAVTDSVSSSANEKPGNKKRKIVTESAGEKNKAQSTSTVQPGSSAADEAGLGDREFAQQLAKAQAGTDFKKTDAQKSKQKTKATKQSQAKKLEASGTTTETSSSAGRDADDDLTPVEETVAEPQPQTTARAGDVSDMLEAPGARPTTLRLTGVSEENKKKKKPTSQPFEEVLTKKQRQTQARKEELRQMKEESDRLHEAKKQEQLRRARMASGTSNQTKANNFTSSSNAWQSSQGAAAVKSAPSTQPAPLLDTFEPQPRHLGQTNGAVHTEDLSATQADSAASLKDQVGEQKASAIAASSREGPSAKTSVLSAALSEEDQIQLIKDQAADDAWESVTSKKSKKKTKADNDEGSDTGSAAQHQAPAPATVRSQVSNKAGNDMAKRSAPGNSSSNRFGAIPVETTSGMMDAEWEA